jgi:hypothetical protein
VKYGAPYKIIPALAALGLNPGAIQAQGCPGAMGIMGEFLTALPPKAETLGPVVLPNY